MHKHESKNGLNKHEYDEADNDEEKSHISAESENKLLKKQVEEQAERIQELQGENEKLVSSVKMKGYYEEILVIVLLVCVH